MADISETGDVNPGEIANMLQAAGVAGAGGAGFPSYVKWTEPDTVSYLIINHQESEPNYYADKWIGQTYATELGKTFNALLDTVFDAVVVGTKQKYRGTWMDEFEVAAGAAIVMPEDLPMEIEGDSEITFAYTPDVYTYSEEKVLLMVTTGTQIGDDLPTEHGWIVHNTETLLNISRALRAETPVTRKFVHVDGDTPDHRCLEVPIGTPATALLAAAGIDDVDDLDGQVLADGGPGWCYEIEQSPDEFGVRKRTNALLVLNSDLAEERTQEDGQIDVLTTRDWTDADRPHETTPTPLQPACVRIPLITNEAYTGLVQPSIPAVNIGDYVHEGDVVAEPHPEAISNTQHASIDGRVTAATDTHIVIERE